MDRDRKISDLVDIVIHLIQENQDLKKQIAIRNKEARIDFLTGLGNKRHQQEEVARLHSLALGGHLKGSIVCVCSIDVDNMKGINDSQGHDAGDARLIEVAETIRKNIRSTDVAARTGGDEFTIVALFDEETEFKSFKRRVTEELMKIETSIGFSSHRINMDFNFNELFKTSDQHMYAGRRKGDNNMKAGGQ